MINNYKQYFMRNAKALLIVMISCFAFVAKGQTITPSVTPQVSPFAHYTGQDTIVTFQAADYDAGTRFVLWPSNASLDLGDSDTEDGFLGSTSIQGANQTFNFEWPSSGSYDLMLLALQGDGYGDELESFTYDSDQGTQTASNGDGYFYRSGYRSWVTDAIDLDVTDTVSLSFSLYTYDGLYEDSTNVVKISYKPEGSSTYTTLFTDADTDTLNFDNWPSTAGTVNIGLPDAAKTAGTTFKIEQIGSDTLNIYELYYRVYDLEFSIGEQYSIEGSTNLGTFFVSNPAITIDSVEDASGNNISSAYPGDDITVYISIDGVTTDTDYKYAAVLENGVDLGLTLTNASGTDNKATLSGTIPLNADYDNWDIEVYAYDASDAAFYFSDNYNPDFGDEDDYAELTVLGGEEDGGILEFDGIAERSVTFPAQNMIALNSDGIYFGIARLTSDLSMAGTGVIFEYSTDEGATFTGIDTLELNSLPVYGSVDYYELSPEDFGTFTDATVFRFRQQSNNGIGLDAWVLSEFEISSDDNSLDFINYDWYGFNVLRPAITQDNLDISTDLPYPGTDLVFTYTITEGEFPSGSMAYLMMERSGTSYDLILGTETITGTSESISFTVPPIEEGDYDLYLMINEEEYNDGISLPVYDLGVSITDISYSDPVEVEGVEHGILGSTITVEYDYSAASSGATVIISVYDYDEGEYVAIGEQTDISVGSVSAILPTDTAMIDYTDGGSSNPYVQLSIGAGTIFEDESVYSETVFNVYYGADPDDSDIIASAEGLADYYWDDDFGASGARSITYEPVDVSLGGYFEVRIYSTNRFTSDYDVIAEVSLDGETWEEYDRVTVSSSYSYYYVTDDEIPSEYWSDETYFRVRYEDEFAAGVNVSSLYRSYLSTPDFLTVIGDESAFNLIEPVLNLGPIEDRYIKGDEITVTYNALYWPAGVEFALVVEQNDVYEVLGTSTETGASSITGTLPIMELDEDGLFHDLFIYPYRPTTTGVIEIASELVLDQSDDYILNDGDYYPDDFDEFYYEDAGERTLVTRAIDLTVSETAYLSFYYEPDNDFELTDNNNIIPRLQASTDGGATWTNVPLYDEETSYPDGFLYYEDDYWVEIPSEFMTSATHFRWTQPLNTGQYNDEWYLEDIAINFDDDNRIKNFQYADDVDNGKSVEIDRPDLGNYAWMQADQDDAVFNGESFDYYWGIEDELVEFDSFPAGTEFVFTISETDPLTGENIVIDTTNALGEFSASVPSFLESGNYSVYVTAVIDIDDEPYMIYDESNVGSLTVFERAVRVSYVGNPLSSVYAGSTVQFYVDLENDETAPLLGDLYANLIVDFDGDDWLLASELNADTITVDLLPFMDGSVDVRVEMSEAPIGEIGEIVESNVLGDLEDDEDNFISGYVDTYDYIEFDNSSGRRTMTTRSFTAEEMENVTLFQFYLYFDRTPEDLTADQYLEFEYSTDNGTTYSSLATYPDMDIEDDMADDVFKFAVTEDMKSGVRFRWRQEEAKGYAYLEDVRFTYAEPLPFDAIVLEDFDIDEQALLISSVGSEEICTGDSVTLNYEIRGRFGADNEINVYFESDDSDGYADESFAISEGSGTIKVSIPNDALDESSWNQFFKFYLEAYDDTYEDVYNDYDVEGPWSEQFVEVVAPIEPATSFSVADALACESTETLVYINSPQNYFMYEVINTEDGSVLGSVTYDATEGINEVSIGVLDTDVELGLIVHSMSSLGTACNTATSTYTEEVQILENYALYRYASSAGTYVPVEAGETLTICEGTNDSWFAIYRATNSGTSWLSSAASIEWFRDDLSNPIVANATLGDNEDILVSGSYFARISDGSCVYLTESIDITVLETPDRPEVTVESGSLISCDGDIEVVLSAPEGFNHYQWTNGERTRSITVEDAGSYQVRVSDISFDIACGSPYSKSVVVESISSPDFNVMSSSSYDEDNFVDGGSVVENCDAVTLYFFENNSYGNSGTVTIYSVADDGTETVYATTIDANISISESGMYRADRFSSDVNATCVESTGVFEVVVNEIPLGTPSLTVEGDLVFCTGEGSATLTAPAGFDYYQWYRNGATINSNQSGFANTSNSISVTEGGTYSVKVGNAAGCYGRVSNRIEIKERVLPNLPSLTQTDATCGEGVIEFRINSANASYSYQLINAETGIASGAPVKGNSSTTTYIYSDAVSEATQFYVEVSYFDGSGCVNFSEFSTYTGRPNNVLLEMDGATIDAIISDYSGWQEIRWYRNGVELRNKTNSYSVTVLDNAEYMVEVDFEGAGGVCTVSSNAVSADGGGRTSLPDGASIVASTYPNPTTDVVNLEIPGEELGTVRVQIMTLSGQIVMDQSFEKSAEQFTQQINISTFETGIYNMTVRQGSKVENIRIVKQ